jgi:hypothetical protein
VCVSRTPKGKCSERTRVLDTVSYKRSRISLIDREWAEAVVVLTSSIRLPASKPSDHGTAALVRVNFGQARQNLRLSMRLVEVSHVFLCVLTCIRAWYEQALNMLYTAWTTVYGYSHSIVKIRSRLRCSSFNSRHPDVRWRTHFHFLHISGGGTQRFCGETPTTTWGVTPFGAGG